MKDTITLSEREQQLIRIAMLGMYKRASQSLDWGAADLSKELLDILEKLSALPD